ncbi:hypothetical protein BHU72_06770 [Desulfuribacillus stibiiarsenatis]|uniref:STAS domain-containing protein n=1 Tax=Desulfuribacillus stibiiarsenatis TaxID=1390249 RepID=A0A1E5L478_9FIRM|nr:STAS domain-containing protein [Desulfuribacillus stibiiarsenatis]OEH84891.1 hypothetical protein BHU72_06770 [Desulfuribacillus stibiiarsenatis]
MEISRIDQDTVIVRPLDHAITLYNAETFKDALLQVMDEGTPSVIIDLQHVTNIDSTGLGKILVFNKRLKEQERSLRLINVNHAQIKTLFSVIRLYEIIEIEGM